MYILMKRKFADGVRCHGVSVHSIKDDEPETIRKFFLDFYMAETEHILSFRSVITGYKITESILDYEGL